jgi:gamma-glutamyltranspeptidase/glutathione hydrolase
MSMGQILEPTIKLGDQGFPVHPVCAHTWSVYAEDLASGSPNSGELLVNGHAPVTGEIFHNPGFVQTLRDIAN